MPPSESKKVLDRLADLRADAPETPEDWAALLLQAGRQRAGLADGGLATGELLDGLHVHPEDLAAAQAPTRLAADDRARAAWASPPWVLHTAPHPDGGLMALLEGPGAASLHTPDGPVTLPVGRWTQVPGPLSAPELVLDDGSRRRLTKLR